MEAENKKVFVSYAWDSNEHKQWVAKLATNLRQHGVDAILDQWDVRLGDDLSFFMGSTDQQSSIWLYACAGRHI